MAQNEHNNHFSRLSFRPTLGLAPYLVIPKFDILIYTKWLHLDSNPQLCSKLHVTQCLELNCIPIKPSQCLPGPQTSMAQVESVVGSKSWVQAKHCSPSTAFKAMRPQQFRLTDSKFLGLNAGFDFLIFCTIDINHLPLVSHYFMASIM